MNIMTNYSMPTRPSIFYFSQVPPTIRFAKISTQIHVVNQQNCGLGIFLGIMAFLIGKLNTFLHHSPRNKSTPFFVMLERKLVSLVKIGNSSLTIHLVFMPLSETLGIL